MDLNTYQKEASKTNITSDIVSKFGIPPWLYLVLGLVGEAGEVAEKLKKLLRNNEGRITEEVKDGIKKELGDVLWYLSQLAAEFGLTLEEVARTNVEKLRSRQKRGVIRSEGDDR